MANYTGGGLYLWNKTDPKITTIEETAKSMQKIDDSLVEKSKQTDLLNLSYNKFQCINIVEKLAAKGDSVNNDGLIIQQAIDSFNTTNITWSTAHVGVVLIPEGDFLIKSPLRMKEGVYLLGVSQYASRLRFDFTGGSDGIVNATLDGLTFNKNFGFMNLSFLPDYNQPGGYGVNFINFVNAIEPFIHNCRFIMHKGAVGGGELTATAIKLDGVINADFDNIVFDGGTVGIKTSGGTQAYGMIKSRLRNLFFYDQKDQGLELANASVDNNISTIHIEQPNQSGTNYGIQLDTTSGGNEIAGVTALGSQLKYGIIVHSAKNTLSGLKIKEALTQKLYMDNADNTVTSEQLTMLNGFKRLKTTPIVLSTLNTWYTVGNVHFTAANSGVYVRAQVNVQIEGLGRRTLKKAWFFDRASSYPTVTENTAEAYSNAAGFEFQWANGTANADMNLQLRFTSGTSVISTSVLIEVNDGNATAIPRDGTA